MQAKPPPCLLKKEHVRVARDALQRLDDVREPQLGVRRVRHDAGPGGAQLLV
jgi:hypothetical protein